MDPFDGYSSCPDTSRIYQHISADNQMRWMQKSERAIQKFIECLPSLQNFHEAYVFLAHHRHEIAFELKQKSEEGLTDNFGLFRTEGDHFRQTISAGDGEQFWKWQKAKIFELTYALVTPLRENPINPTEAKYYIEDDFLTCMREKVMVDEKSATYFCVNIKFSKNMTILKQVKCAPFLAQIELFDYDDYPNLNTIRIEYTPIDNSNMPGHLQILNMYYHAMLAWSPADGVTQFLADAANLSYLLAHFLFVKQGNSGIVEWMIRAIAFNNGLALGKFNRASGISWDFKAILTPDPKQYQNWFATSLFADWTLIDPVKMTPKFSYHYKNEG